MRLMGQIDLIPRIKKGTPALSSDVRVVDVIGSNLAILHRQRCSDVRDVMVE